MVIARLLLPFTSETSLVGNLVQNLDLAILQINTSDHTNSPLSPEIDFTEHDTLSKNQADTTTEESPELEKTLVQRVLETAAQNIWLICGLVWFMVAVGLLIRRITMYQSFVKYLNAGRMEIADMRLWEQLGKLVEQTGMKRTVELYTNSLISSPLLIGFLHPCIMLPSAELSDSDLKNTLLHELTHYKRRDMFYKWFVQFTICPHWFNPFVYLMSLEVNRTCELSCDEAAIKSLNEEGRRTYGNTLLNAVGIGGNYKNSLATFTLNDCAELLKERLDAIMNYQKKSKFIVSITLIATALFCTGATTVGAYAATYSSDSFITSIPPWAVLGETGQPYIYSQSAYYQGSYIFELGWNLNEKGFDVYVDKAELTLSDRSIIIVSFDKSCRSEAQNQAVLSDLKDLIEKLKAQNDNFAPLERPLVVSINYIGDNDLIKLAEEYYTDDELAKFSAIFPWLDKEAQIRYCDKMVEDDKLAFFSTCAEYMNTNIIAHCAEKIYQEDKLNFFDTIVPYLTDEQKQEWIARIFRDDRIRYFILIDEYTNTTAPNTSPSSINEPTYTYSQNKYYQGSYIFELGWNLSEKAFNTCTDKAELTLSDHSTITVAFNTLSESQDQTLLSNLKDLIERLKAQNDNSAPLERPLVVSVKYIGDNGL